MGEESKEKKPKQYNAYLKYSGLAIQMGLTIYAANLLGEFFDTKYNQSDELYSKIITLTAVFISIASVIIQVTKNQD